MKQLTYILLFALLAYSCTDYKQRNAQEESDSIQTTVVESPTSYDDEYINQNSNQDYIEFDGTSQEKSVADYNTPDVTITTSSSFNLPEEQEENSDWHKWESEDIRGFYVEIEDCNSDDEAEAISERYSNGEYIEEWGRYFMPTDVRNGEYEVELGERVTNKLFNLKGTNVFNHFKWSTSYSRWDEGVIDVWSNRGTFYKKP